MDERVTKLEVEVCSLKEDLKELKEMIRDMQNKLNGYLDVKVKTLIKSMIGEILIAVITSSAFISFVIALLKR